MKKTSTRGSKAYLTLSNSPPGSGMQNTTSANSGTNFANFEDKITSENDMFSPRDSREVAIGDFEVAP